MRTKIVCTLGPATDTEDVLRRIIRAGMDVARMNFSHGKHEDHARRIAAVRRIAAEEGALVAIMGDLQGPKFRIGTLPAEGVLLVKDAEVMLTSDATPDVATQPPHIPFLHLEVVGSCKPGQKLLIDDGALVLQVIAVPEFGKLRCKVLIGGTLTSRKGVSVPGTKIPVSPVTLKDDDDVAFAVQQGVDAIALSFVQQASDVQLLRERIHSLGGDQLIVSKIENHKPSMIWPTSFAAAMW